jgi:hypothetical protein
MSRGHGASRRRNYGRRQSEVRRRRDTDISVDLQGPDAWPRGSGWDRDGGSGADGGPATGYAQANGSAG